MAFLRVMAFVICLSQCAYADNGAEVRKQFGFVSEYFANGGPRVVYRMQAVLKVMELYDGKVDGIWGKKTEAAILNRLESYISIGGVGEDWGVRNPVETERFLDWIVDAGLATTNQADFPD